MRRQEQVTSSEAFFITAMWFNGIFRGTFVSSSFRSDSFGNVTCGNRKKIKIPYLLCCCSTLSHPITRSVHVASSGLESSRICVSAQSKRSIFLDRNQRTRFHPIDCISHDRSSLRLSTSFPSECVHQLCARIRAHRLPTATGAGLRLISGLPKALLRSFKQVGDPACDDDVSRATSPSLPDLHLVGEPRGVPLSQWDPDGGRGNPID